MQMRHGAFNRHGFLLSTCIQRSHSVHKRHFQQALTLWSGLQRNTFSLWPIVETTTGFFGRFSLAQQNRSLSPQSLPTIIIQLKKKKATTVSIFYAIMLPGGMPSAVKYKAGLVTKITKLLSEIQLQ